MKYVLFLTVFILTFAGSCDRQPIAEGVHANADLAEMLRSCAEKVSVGDHEMELTTYLWRDFMPIAEDNGSTLRCVNKLVDIHDHAIPSSLSLIKQYVIHADTVWTAKYEDVKHAPPHVLEGRVRGGPKWGPDIVVDVVCEFEYEGDMHRILARNQKIFKTH